MSVAGAEAFGPGGRSQEPGVRFSDGSGLVAAALEALHDSPQPTETLAYRVFGLRSAPPGLAERLLAELFRDDPRVSRNGRGVWRLAQAPPTASAPLRGLGYAVVDVETTGGSPERGGRIVEIAVVEVRDGKVTAEFSSLVNPGVPLPTWITRLTGIEEPMLASAPSFEELSGEIQRRLEGRVFVAHNAAFDWRFVAAEMLRARSLLPSGPRLCTIHLARRALPGLRRRGLDSLARYYGIPIYGRHRALGDATATAAILGRLLRECDRNGIGRWAELQGWLAGRRPTAQDEPPC